LYIFTLCLGYLNREVDNYSNKADVHNQLIAYTRHYSHYGKYMMFSIYFPFESIEAHSVSRFNSFWMLPGLLKQKELHPKSQKIKYYKKLIAEGVITDIANNKPKIIYVDHARYKNNLAGIRFSFIEFLEEYPGFNKVWRNYRYQQEIGSYSVYLRR